MALVVMKSTLNSAQEDQIARDLHVQPQINNYTQAAFTSKSVKSYILRIESDGTWVYYLPLYYALSVLKLQYPVSNAYLVYHPVEFTGTLREEQKVFANQILSRLERQYTAGLTVRPAMGKTTLSVAIACKLGLLTVILVHDSGLVPQWVKTCEVRTKATVWAVGDKKVPPRPNIIVCLYTRTKKIPVELRRCVGFLIIDEAHEFCNPTGVESILDFQWSGQQFFILALTATWTKANQMHKVLEHFTGPDPITGPLTIPFKYSKIITGCKAKRVKNVQDNTDWSILIQSLLYSKRRNAIIVNLVIKLLMERQRKIIVFTSEVDHVIQLNSLLLASGVTSCDYLTGDKSKYQDSMVLVGNIQKCGTGFDEEMYCDNFGGRRIDTCIIATSFKDTALLAQVIGRTFRSDDPHVYHMVDSDPTIARHWRECSQWYSENKGTEMEKMDYTMFTVPETEETTV